MLESAFHITGHRVTCGLTSRVQVNKGAPETRHGCIKSHKNNGRIDLFPLQASSGVWHPPHPSEPSEQSFSWGHEWTVSGHSERTAKLLNEPHTNPRFLSQGQLSRDHGSARPSPHPREETYSHGCEHAAAWSLCLRSAIKPNHCYISWPKLKRRLCLKATADLLLTVISTPT